MSHPAIHMADDDELTFDQSVINELDKVETYEDRREHEAEVYAEYIRTMGLKGQDLDGNEEEFHETEKEELAEQYAAQISILACEIPALAIKEAIRAAVNDWRMHGKTRYEMNMMKKRDFKYGVKENDKEKKKKEDALSEEFERFGKANYGGIDEYPTPYVRDYKYKNYELTLKSIHPKLDNYSSLGIVDLGNQLIGDDKLIKLCDVLYRCPVITLILTKNSITDEGMEKFASILRNFKRLKELNLSHNNITDKGVELMFSPNYYPPLLQVLHMSFNPLTNKSAYHIGGMFSAERHCALDSLYLGGKLGKVGFGDDFIRVLVAFLCAPNARPLKLLNFPESGITDDGFAALATLITCSNTIETLNISKNSLVSTTGRSHLITALRCNQSIKLFYLRQCGLNRTERGLFMEASASKSPLTWHEQTLLALLCAREYDNCIRSKYKLDLLITNKWEMQPPPPWPNLYNAAHCGAFTNVDMKFFQSYLTRDNLQILPVDVIATLKHIVRVVPLVDTLIAGCDKADEYLGEVTNKFLTDGTLNFTAMEAQNFIIRECDRDRAYRRENLVTKRAMCQNIFDTYITYQKTVMGLIEAADQGWNKQKQEKCKFTSNHVSMALEDYNAGLVGFGESLEHYMGKVHELKLITNKNDISKAIPYSRNLLVAGSYTHFLYTEWPEVEYTNRIRRQRQELADAMKAMKEARKKKSGKANKVGKRFQITLGIKALDEQERLDGGSVETSLPSKEKRDKKDGPKEPFMNKAARRQSNFIVDQANRRASSMQPSMIKRQASMLASTNEDHVVSAKVEPNEEQIKYLAMLAEANNAEFEDDKVVHYISVFRPSYEKQLMFKKLNTFEINGKARDKALLGLNRNNRRYNIRPVELSLLPVQGVKPDETVTTVNSEGKPKFLPVYFEDEDVRNEPVGSFSKVDVTRLLVSMEDRAMLRQEQRRNHRSILLRLIPDYEELPPDFTG